MIVEGQLHGSVAAGLGQALMENIVYDTGSGQLVTGSFMDYAMPRADDMPPLRDAHAQRAGDNQSARRQRRRRSRHDGGDLRGDERGRRRHPGRRRRAPRHAGFGAAAMGSLPARQSLALARWNGLAGRGFPADTAGRIDASVSRIFVKYSALEPTTRIGSGENPWERNMRMQKLLLLHDRRPCRRSAVGRRAGAKWRGPHRQGDFGARADDGRRAGQRQARGSNITTTVVTNEQGVYSFPAARLAPGHYTHHDARRRLQARRPEGGRRLSRAAATADLKLTQDQRTRQPALQRRMAQQPARRRQASRRR